MRPLATKKIITTIIVVSFTFSQALSSGFAATQPVVEVQVPNVQTQPQTDALAQTFTGQTVPASSATQTTATSLDFLASPSVLSASQSSEKTPTVSTQALKTTEVVTPGVTSPATSVSDTPFAVLSGTKAAGESVWISSNGGRTYTRLVAANTSTTWSASANLVSGANNFMILAKDTASRQSAAVTVPTITYTVTAPAVTPPPATTGAKSIILSGTKASGDSIWISSNGGKSSYTQLVANNNSTTWSATVSLVNGANNFTILAADVAYNSSAVVVVPTITYASAPVAAPGVTPPSTTVSNNPVTLLSGTKTAGESLWISSDSGKTYTQLVANNNSTTWSASVSLVSGANNFMILAKDTASRQSAAVTVPTITYTVTVPTVTLPPATISTDSVTLSGTKALGGSVWISSDSGKTYTQLVANNTSTAWFASVSLVTGANNFTIIAKDTASNQSATVIIPTITSTYIATTPVPGSQVMGSMQGTTLVITGTNSSDNIDVTQNASGAIVVSSSVGKTVFAGTIQEIDVYGFEGNDTVHIASGVLVPAKIYTGSGNNQVFADNAAKHELNAGSGDDLFVSLNGTEDILNGGTGFDSFWCDVSDIINNLSADEVSNNTVHRIGQFYQPYTTSTASSYYIPLTLAGQNLPDPTGSGVLVNVSSSPLFNNGMVYYNDIQQGNLGDCYFLAGLASLASAESEILLQSIVPFGDGTYGVRFYNNGAANYLRIDGDIFETGGRPTYAGFGSGGDIWAMLLEKAFAFFRVPGKNSYSSLSSGYLQEPFSALTGKSYTTLYTSSVSSGISDAQLYNSLQAELSSGYAVTLGSNSKQPTNSMVVGSHAYSLRSVQTINGVMYATVYNPWGIVNSGMASYNGNPNGILTLTMAQLQQDFAYACASLAVVPGPAQQSAVKQSSNNGKTTFGDIYRTYYRILGRNLSGDRSAFSYPFWSYAGAFDRYFFGNELSSN